MRADCREAGRRGGAGRKPAAPSGGAGTTAQRVVNSLARPGNERSRACTWTLREWQTPGVGAALEPAMRAPCRLFAGSQRPMKAVSLPTAGLPHLLARGSWISATWALVGYKSCCHLQSALVDEQRKLRSVSGHAAYLPANDLAPCHSGFWQRQAVVHSANQAEYHCTCSLLTDCSQRSVGT